MAKGASSAVGAMSLAAAIATLVMGGAMFASSCLMRWRIWGIHNVTQDFDLWRQIGFGLLAFATQSVFGVFFGLRAARFEASGGEGWVVRGPRTRSINPGIFWLLFWLVLCNLPIVCEFWRALRVPGMLHALRAHHIALWPPHGLYTPVRNDLSAFLPLGNLGLLVGFLAAFGVARLRDSASDPSA